MMITTIDKQTALVLIDLQKGIARRETIHPMSKVLLKASMLVDVFREANLPIVVVHVNPLGGAWTKTRVEVTALSKHPLMQTFARFAFPMMGFMNIVPEIKTQPEDILIEKKTWNAFFETPLDAELKKRGVTQLV